MSIAEAASKIVERLAIPEESAGRPVLVLLSGLPGTGKSYFARRLAKATGAIVIETDMVRRTLYHPPRYTPGESFFVYQVSHHLIRDLLQRGHRVIFDATNLREAKREDLYRIADHARARLVIVRMVAPPEMVRERLERRQLRPSPEDLSEATWEVYQHMRPGEERIRRPHLVVDTSQEISSSLTRVIRAMRSRDGRQGSELGRQETENGGKARAEPPEP
jgi:predicted kinase